jgi:hypothetical protein
MLFLPAINILSYARFFQSYSGQSLKAEPGEHVLNNKY